MSLATTTDTTAIKPALLSKYEIQRNERHAKAQIRSDAKRREKNAPRRDDMARAAYYALMMFYEEAGTEADRASFRDPFVRVLTAAGYPPEVCSALFDGHVGSLLDDLDGWLAQRWYTEGRRLKDNRSRYVPLDRGNPKKGKVGSTALTSFLAPSANRSAAD
ncbi:hypothetical protein [Methylobacterium sp. J-092]|uniref:hypothetical protein n=1 Tax=Methylobacterium sp. J-092 TaxID=2836667 RepID=UPI001FBB333B|nr:hypothetical protein [Methylobacterium sp. J-092]MCJ2008082.1 hypothetical protein [Methylobacterium sp. J-092]